MAQNKNSGLSKTSLLKGMQCGKALYLYKNNYKERDPVSRSLQAKFDRGHSVGKLAQSLFPGGKDCTPPSVFQYDQSIAATKALTMAQFPVIYEAAFKHEGVMVALDILCFRDGKWYGYEVKSSVRTSKTYLQDAAIQYQIITKSGLQLEDIFLVHLNGQYIRDGELDLNQLFQIVSVKEEVLEQQAEIEAAILAARDVLAANSAPEIAIGTHCYKPYACDFLGKCWNGLEKNPILQLAGSSLQERIEWLMSGIRKIEDIPVEALSKTRTNAQFQVHKTQTPYVDLEAMKGFFSQIDYPLYFFDIEAYQPAVPIFDHTTPFQPIPFLFSIHYVKSKEEDVLADVYIAAPDGDNREAFLKAFLEATKEPGQIVVFNTLLEKGILYQLGKLFPSYAGAIKERVLRMVDLETPFKKDWFYHPGMLGGYSMKNILPALVPELSYNNLNIRDGADAMLIYQQLVEEKDDVKKEAQLADLKAYCQMDTLGLYKVYLYLESLIEKS